MRKILTLITLSALVTVSALPQDRHDWQQAITRLHTGENLRLSLKTNSVNATFISASADELTTDAGATKKDDVLKIERFTAKRGGSRKKHALFGTLIGAGGGAAIGAVVGRCTPTGLFNSCIFSHGQVTAAFAVMGAVSGAVIGALIPAGRAKKETIYSVN